MEESRILEALKLTLPFIKECLKLDMQICLCDREKTIGVWYGDSIHLEIQTGERFNPNSPADGQMLHVMEIGEGVESILPPQVYGVPVRGILSPVYEDGNVVGVISFAISIQEQKELESSADNLNQNITRTNENFRKIAQTASDLAQKAQNINKHTEGISDLTESTSQIVGQIEKNAQRSNILALNAAIESARAGDKGKGFAVVAGEMGKLSKASGESAKIIGEKLNDVFQKLKGITEELAEISNIVVEQADGVNSIDDSLKKIESEASALSNAVKTSI